MKSNYDILGNHIRLIDTRNRESITDRVLGINIDKFFMPSVANVIGTDLSKYKLITKGKFACNPMHVGRDERLPVALYDEEEPAIVSPAYFMFEVVDNSILNEDYLMMWFRRPEFDRICWLHTDGSVRGGITWDDICRLELPIPPIEKQLEIVNSYKAITERIALKKKINDNLQQQLCLIYENMMCKAQYGNIEGTFTVASKLTDVVTGKEDANFASPNGKYKFFTCSNDTLNCDEYVFDSSAILIAGNGDFNVKHYSGKFNAYQRTYVLIPDHQYYGLLYFASLYQINSFKSASSGSIVKFITKGDIENIPVFIPNDEHILNELNRLLALQEKNQAENEELSSLRDWLLPMLMNGQASISD